MKRLLSLVGLSTLFIAAICGDGDTPAGSDATIPADLTLDQLYDRMEQAMSHDGQVLYTTITIDDIQYTFPEGEPTPDMPDDIDWDDYATKMWFLPGQNVMRMETPEYDEEELSTDVKIIREKTELRDEDGRPTTNPLLCRGSDSALVTRLIGCGNYLEESETVLEAGEYDGKAAIVLRSFGELPSHDWTSQFEERLFIDPATYLPIAATIESSVPFETVAIQRFEHEYIELRSLPNNFFEGEPAEDTVANLVPDVGGMRVYWLGRLFDPPGDLPQLTLMGGHAVLSTYPGSPYQASLDYEMDERANPTISLQEFSLDAWGTAYNSGVVPAGEGVTTEELTYADRRAVLYRMPDEYPRYRAHVYFETAVVMVGDFHVQTPYASHEGMLAIIEALRPFDE